MHNSTIVKRVFISIFTIIFLNSRVQIPSYSTYINCLLLIINFELNINKYVYR